MNMPLIRLSYAVVMLFLVYPIGKKQKNLLIRGGEYAYYEC